MFKRKFISAVYITRNGEEFIEQSIQSIIDYVDEIIVVDNNSIDKTMDIINSFPQQKFIIESKEFKGKHLGEIKKRQRNRYLELAKGQYILVLDSDEVYKKSEIEWLINFLKNNKDFVSIHYKSIQFWKDFDHHITGPHWDNPQERCFKNLPNLNYNKFHFSVSEGNEVLAKKYGKNGLNKIFKVNSQVYIYHYAMCKSSEKIREKIRAYMLRDNPPVNMNNVEEFVDRHPYFSGKLNQPRHGPKGLWIAGVDGNQKEQIVPFLGQHPETMIELINKEKNKKESR